MQRFNLKELKKAEGKEQYRIEIKSSLKKHKPWFHEGC
jgi:hypothetical protein